MDDFFNKKSLKKEIDDKYSLKINKLIYTPNSIKPYLLELLDDNFTKKLIKNINNSSITIEEKEFLIKAAQRHLVFNYAKIADYYANASKEMQELMEDSGLVIIDFKKGIEQGYIDLSLEISKQYIEDKNHE
jgi:predicted glycosyl hydrolase (DUF1957 family)